MGLKIYKNRASGELKRSLTPLDKTQWEEVLSAPNRKFMESADPIKGISRLRNQTKILRERSRNYARDREIDDNIQINRINGLDENVAKSFLNSKREKRRKIDDI